MSLLNIKHEYYSSKHVCQHYAKEDCLSPYISWSHCTMHRGNQVSLNFKEFSLQCGERKIQRLWNNHLQIDQFSPEGKTERNKKFNSSSYNAWSLKEKYPQGTLWNDPYLLLLVLINRSEISVTFAPFPGDIPNSEWWPFSPNKELRTWSSASLNKVFFHHQPFWNQTADLSKDLCIISTILLSTEEEP